jgi:glycolate oxidase iron-sulfur subunit
MQTNLSPEFAQTAEGEEATGILRKCVHCGFCNATCPTYQLLGDELDGPRGRIYLIKQVLEGAPVTRSTQQHLDRCLTCLNCETTCPSGVKYGDLVEIGRKIVDERVERPVSEKAARWMLREGMTSPLFAPAMAVGKALRPLLPKLLQDKVPAGTHARELPHPPLTVHRRKVLMLRGCVQPAMLPNIDRAAARVFDAAGIQVIDAAGTGCCGALRTHLSDHAGGLDNMRRNIDAWIAVLDSTEVEAIVSSASACQLAIKDYAQALSHDVQYAAKAARISALARDLSEFLPDLVEALKDDCEPGKGMRAVFHSPCTLQHGQKLRGGVEAHLRELGFDVLPPAAEAHLCCGSAGTYSVLQPELSRQLRDRKLKNIAAAEPQCILSANVGCIQHLQSGTSIPVKHWIELLDEALV